MAYHNIIMHLQGNAADLNDVTIISPNSWKEIFINKISGDLNASATVTLLKADPNKDLWGCICNVNRENKAFNATLKAAKQDVFDTMGKTGMGIVFKAAVQNTLKVLKALELPTNQCARYILWGGCGDKTCQKILTYTGVKEAHNSNKHTTKKLANEEDKLEPKESKKFHSTALCIRLKMKTRKSWSCPSNRRVQKQGGEEAPLPG